MSEDTFRIVVTVAVLLASLAFVVQAGIVLALYRMTRKIQDQTSGFVERLVPVLVKVEPMFDKAGPVIERIGPALDSVSAAAAKVGPAVEQIVEKTSIFMERGGQLVKTANQVAFTANQILQETRPKIANLSDETLAIVHSGREQVERMGDLLHDAGDRARTRLEQVDHAVESTVNQIENVSGTVKSAVMRPVREVNGLAAGISAAVSTLVRGHKSSVDSATQDEEMFI
jgi:methyl-accepting chemotaxis protein